MKLFFIVFALSLVSSAFASEQTFTCKSGEESYELTLTPNHVQFHDVTFTNLMDVETKYPYRGYSFINDPWMSLSVSTEMLNGQNGVAFFLVTNLKTGDSLSTTFSCSK